MRPIKTSLVLLFLCAFLTGGLAQSKKLFIQTYLPSDVTICGKSDSVVFEINNITGSSITSINLNLSLPPGIYYVANSAKGNGVSQFNISNLNAPVFALPNMNIAGFLRLSLKLQSTCDLQSFISKGNSAILQLNFTYSGGNESHASNALNVNIPNILINTISNQVFNAYLGTKFRRDISLRNTGKGGISGFTFFRTIGNGLKVNSSRNKDKYKADSIISLLDSNDFKLVGNKDIYLDAGEEVKITDTVLVTKCNNLNSFYNLQFGCGKTICNTSTKNAIVNLDPFNAGLTIIPSSKIDWCFDKNKPSTNQLIIINKSNKPIYNTSLNVLQSYSGGFYNYLMSALDTLGMTLTKGKYGPKLTKNFTGIRYNNYTSYFACLGSLPIGGFTLDIGDMNVGDTLYINWKVISCIPDVCNTTLTAHRWRYSATYEDACGQNYTVAENWGSTGGVQYMTATNWIPTDLEAGVPDKLNFTFSSISFFNYTYAKSLFKVKLTLDYGIKQNLNSNDFKFTDVNGSDWKPYLIVKKGNDIFAYFNQPNISLTKAELNITVEADCSVSNPSGPNKFSLEISYNPDTACISKDFKMYCTSGNVVVHCSKSCANGGMQFKSFRVVRKNFGKPDNNNDGVADASGTLDFKKVKTNRTLVYDTISTYYAGMVNSSGSVNMFFNGRIKTSVTNGHLLKPLVAILYIYRGGKVRYTCNKMQVTSYLSGTIRYCEIDLNLNAASTAGCPNLGNYFFRVGDSVVVNLNYVYTTSIGYYSGNAFFVNNEFYLSTVSNPSASQKLQCDTFSGNHILLGSYFTNWYTENYSSSTCNPTSLQNSFYFSAGNCCDNYAGGNPFPFEYRNFNYLDKIKVALPKGYRYSSAALYYYRSAGTSKYATEYSTKFIPQFITSDTLLFNLDTFFNPSKGVFKRSDEGYQGTLVLNLIPSCKVALNTYETVKYYSYFKWPDVGVTQLIENYVDSIKFNHPNILLNAINSVSVSKKDTFSWDIIISNTNSGSAINNVWLSNNLPNKAKVISIKDLSTKANLPNSNGIFKAGTLSSSTARTFRINAISNNCKLDSIKIAMGWNCDTYPDSLQSYACPNLLNYLNLVLSPEPPLIVSTLIEDTARTDVCTNRKYEAMVNNTDEDNIYQLKLKVTIPNGTKFNDTGMYYIFPHGSKPQKLSKPLLLNGSTYQWALSDSILALKNGLEKVSDTLKSKIKIQFLLETNCQITAGSFVSIMPEGKIGCGELVKSIGYTGKPIRIKGVDNPYFSVIKFEPDSVNLCSPVSTFNAKIIYLGPTKTLPNDSIILSLPLGFVPDTASLQTVRINGRGTVKEVNGEMRWSWQIPKGLNPGDSSMITFKLNLAKSAPTCGSQVFSVQAVTKKKAFCVKSNDSCDINVSTGYFYKPFKLDRSEPNLKLNSVSSVNAGDSGEILNLKFTAINKKKTIDTSLTTKFYLIFDKNGNGKLDKNEGVVTSFTKTKGWNTNQSVNFSYTGFVHKTNICKLLIVSDTANCQCLQNSLPLLNIQLKNAGRDTSFCTNNTLNIGLDSIKNYKYEWQPSDYLSKPFQSKTIYKKPNYTSNNLIQNYILKTTRIGGCISVDTLTMVTKPFIYLPKLKDTTTICEKGSTNIGDTAKGGRGALTFNWSPTTSLANATKMVTQANPNSSTKYYINIKDANNCAIKDSTYLKVAKYPAVKITNLGNCEKKPIYFTNSSNYFGIKPGSELWRINFNNVGQTNPPFIFDTIGYYFVRLIVSNQYGCTDSNYKYVRVNGNPIVFNSKTNACLGDSVTLSDKSTVARMGVKSVLWKFTADSVQSKSIKRKFATPGYHYFNQKVVSDSGCVSNHYDSIFIFNKPKVVITWNGKCETDSILFTDGSTVNSLDTITSRSWLMNGQNINKLQFKYKFDSANSYKIRLALFTAKGCSDSLAKTLTILPTPKLAFTINDHCNYDTIKIANNTSIKTGKVITTQWFLNSALTVLKTGSVLYPLKEGNYTIKQIAYSDSLCSDSLTKNFKVYPGILAKSAFVQGCENETMDLSDISILGKARAANRLWTIGTAFYTDSSFSMAIQAKGKYSYHLAITTNDGCVYHLDSFYNVLEKPIASFTSVSPCNDNFMRFSDKSDAGINASLVLWKWYDGPNLIQTNQNFSQRFTNSGNKSIGLWVQNSLGCSDSIHVTTSVLPVNYADFNINDACPNDTVYLIDKSITGNNAITNYLIKWGDGNTSNTVPSTNQYSSTGNYTVSMQITTLPNCIYDTLKTVQIYPAPKANFSYYPLFPSVKTPNITLSDKSSGATKWHYYFGDDGFSDLANPNYSYADSGRYRIWQILENQYGCKDSTSQSVYVSYILFTHLPTAFSPGSDDINPLFKPTGLGIKDYRLVIFNRWGEKIFDPGFGNEAWDGKYLGEFVPMGLYPYYLEIIDFGNIRHSYNGVIHVVR
jgi:gliding motility-associated-like protein